MDNKGNVLGVVMTTQTLSLADKVIENNINNSIILLIIVIVLIMLLFLRHSRIIDYMTLYKKLKEVDQLKDDFVSMASHELRTPLSIIRGYASIISEMPSLPLESKDPLAKIDIATKELDLLVADILDVSRIEQGKIPLNMETLNPSQILETVVSSFEIPAKEKGIQISLDRSGVKDNQFIYADKDRLRQIFLNIIGNAVKYTIVGEIKVKPYEEKGRLYIRISDTGIGMSAEEREHLFEKFYRIKAKETANVRGTGLGLWISDKLAKEMNGNISVESIKGVGSHFIIFFPIFSQS
jgi:signal transduction histidine kinase